MGAARTRLRFFRQSTIIALAMTSLLLLLFAPEEAGEAQVLEQMEAEPQVDTVPRRANPDSLARISTEEAANTLRGAWEGFYGNLPKVAVALGILTVAWVLVRVIRFVLRRVAARWERGEAITALSGVVVWLLALGLALTVLAGDIRALVGSIGLVGLALSWALQTPIESFTGWLMNGFQGYYRVGDRIAVGDIFGDVYRIDFLTTTVWEIGGPDRPPGQIRAEQPTGRLITFPNNEVLAGSIVNLTRDFPYVWDELAVGVANESDIRYTVALLERVARETLSDHMVEPARHYQTILRRVGLEAEVPDGPQVFVSLGDESWVDVTIRYLVGARERRKWKSALALRVLEESQAPEHAGKVLPVYPRRQIQLVDPDGVPRELPGTQLAEE
ncbi:hypothetical protein BH23GEM5_BH23GEM5_12070 [soil metagenome]